MRNCSKGFCKLYQVVPNNEAAEHDYITIVDESGEGYWYAAGRFFPVEVPAELARALAAALEQSNQASKSCG